MKYDLRDGFWAVPVHQDSRKRLVMRHPGTGRLVQCRRLPFGYLDSPRLFCSLSEAMASEVRRRVAGLGIHVLCFVDDYLVVGDTEELTRRGGEVFEQVMSEFGLHWAPHKQRGPSRCIEFLGLLVCNVEGLRCIGLSRKRQARLREMISAWASRRPRQGRVLEVGPRELAVLLGHLVFGSQVVPGGRTYMQGMLAQFRGLEVDWNHGQVRFSDHRDGWRNVRVTEQFWRDLEWWDDHFENRNCTSLEEQPLGTAAITGTDASDWGAGQLVWLDGAREEVALRFSAAEQRRSINWRELLGIVRIFEFFGSRLTGRLVLVETDNMAAKGAASKRASKSDDMQELVRRLLELAEMHGIVVRFTHTPGVKLIRPDQTSRGDPLEEPRARLGREEFELLSARFGPFTEFLGAEREHGRAVGCPGDGRSRLWMHPTHSTVGSTLRLLGERLVGGGVAGGVVIVPHDPHAAWWRLTRHFSVVGGWSSGTSGLEHSRLGAWHAGSFARDTLILSFPRAAGAVVRPVWIADLARPVGAGYVVNLEGTARASPLPLRSFVYSPGLKPGSHGVLYMVWKGFMPSRGGGLYDSEASDVRAVEVAQLTRSFSRSGRSRKVVWNTVGGKLAYALDTSTSAAVADRAFAPGVGCKPWAVRADMLWTVDHLVGEVTSTPTQVGASSPRARDESQRTFTFDHEQAEREISRWQAVEVDTSAPDPTTARPPQLDSSEVRVTTRDDLLAGMRRSRRGRGEAELGDVMRSPEMIERRIRAERRAADEARRAADSPLTSVVARLAEVLIDDDAEAPPEGREAAAQADIDQAVASAEEAAAARVHPPRVVTAVREPQVRRLPPLARDGRQPNLYAGTVCAGCGFTIAVGATVRPGGRSVCHDAATCVSLAERQLTEAIAAKQAASRAAAPRGQTSEVHRARLEHRFSADRCAIMRHCVEGKCQSTEARVMCVRGCGRGVHVVACLHMSKAREAKGTFVCGECRAAEMAPFSCSPLPSLVTEGDRNALLELTTGAEGTAANYAEFARLERVWVASLVAGDEGMTPGDFALPRHSMESFIAFLRWLVTDGARARSFHTIFRAAAGVLSQEELGLTNWSKSPRVKMLVKELGRSHGVQSTPDTHATRRILRIMFEQTIASTVSAALRKRTIALGVLETMGGVRIGEACGGGDGHGALANNLCIMRPVGSVRGCPEESLELWIPDSKTCYPRYVNFVGRSHGIGIDAAAAFRALWAEAGLTIVEEIEDGMLCERPDYSVVRVSMVDMGERQIEKLRKVVASARDGELAVHAKATLAKAKARIEARTLGEERRYINVAGGTAGGRGVTGAVAALRDAGLARFVDVVPGPLFRATHGRLLSHMPLAVDSSYTHLMGALRKAWDISSAMEEPDLELDLDGLDQPKWGHHTLRRTATKVARDTMDETGVDEQDLDDMLGWEQAQREKRSQLRYAGRRDRSRRARITMMI